MMETTQEGSSAKPIIDFDVIDEKLVQKTVYDALVWSFMFGCLSLGWNCVLRLLRRL